MVRYSNMFGWSMSRTGKKLTVRCTLFGIRLMLVKYDERMRSIKNRGYLYAIITPMKVYRFGKNWLPFIKGQTMVRYGFETELIEVHGIAVMRVRKMYKSRYGTYRYAYLDVEVPPDAVRKVELPEDILRKIEVAMRSIDRTIEKEWRDRQNSGGMG